MTLVHLSSIKFHWSQVPLGDCLQNEKKLDEMGKILDHYMTLVPFIPSEKEVPLPLMVEMSLSTILSATLYYLVAISSQ